MFRKLTLISLCCSAIYLSYLASTTQALLYHDGVGYESLGRLINEKGWVEYLTTGPNREPLYPFWVSLNMSLAKLCQVPAPAFLIIGQMLILFLTQILMAGILTRLKVSDAIIACTIAYSAFSPAFIYPASITWCEILTFPLILSLLLTANNVFLSIVNQRSTQHCLWCGFSLGLSLTAITMVKGMFEIISPVLLIAIIILALKHSRWQTIWMKGLLCLLSAFIVFSGITHTYKSLNKKYNGQYLIASNGAILYYGTVARRLAPMDTEKFLSYIASIPHQDACHYFFEDKICSYWLLETADEFGKARLSQIQQQNPNLRKAQHLLFTEANNHILQNPLPYMTLTALETLKMFFWEYQARIEYAYYPSWINNIYASATIKNTLRYGIPLLSMLSFAYVLSLLWKRRDQWASEMSYLLVMALIITLFVGCYALFNITGRYLAPVNPLFLMIIAFAIHQRFGIKQR